MNAASKVVFSRTLASADWANSTIASGSLEREMDALKRAATVPSSPTAASASGSRSSTATSSTSTASRLPLPGGQRHAAVRRLWHKVRPRSNSVPATAFGDGIAELDFRRAR